jgi:hypothetical protein
MPFDPTDTSVRVTMLLKGEEAIEFKRWMHRQNIRPGLAGRILLIEGMKTKGLLPKWWRISKK